VLEKRTVEERVARLEAALLKAEAREEAAAKKAEEAEQAAAAADPPAAAWPEQHSEEPWRNSKEFFEMCAVDFDREKLPVLNSEALDTQPKIVACGSLYQVFTYWLNAGAAVPFTFSQLSKETAAGDECKELILRMLGEQAKLWYVAGPAKAEDLLPRQMVFAVLAVLDSGKQFYAKSEEEKSMALASLATLTEQHSKRPRIS
jgi:hypothetical protein